MTRTSFRSCFPARLLAAALLLVVARQAAAADFEGVIESKMKLSGEAGVAGTSRAFVSAAGTRQEMTFGKKGEAMTTVTLVMRARPGLMFLVNDDRKSYVEVDIASTKKATARDLASEKYTVTKLADQKVAGYDCAHGKIQGSKGDRYEVWATREISGAEGYWAGQDGGQQDQGAAIYRAMKQAGLDGWPLKMIVQSKGTGKETMTWEATSVERKSLPGSLFSLAGYKKGEGGPMGAMGQMKLSPAQRKEMDDAMKDMSPAERKQMEEMMKGMQGGK